jgi:hypothetical protein
MSNLIFPLEVLIFDISLCNFIASYRLNVNSTAVIIGAMLISPLMVLSLARVLAWRFWLQLIKRSLKPSSSYASGINCFGYLLYLIPLRKRSQNCSLNRTQYLWYFNSFSDLLRYCYYWLKRKSIPVSLLLRLWCATVHRWWYGLAIGSMKFFLSYIFVLY